MKIKKLLYAAASITFCAAACLTSGIFCPAEEKPDTAGIPIDASVFPDENFRAILEEQADTDNDRQLSASEIQKTVKLEITYPHKKGHAWYGESLSDIYDYPDQEHLYDGITLDVTGLETLENLQTLRFHNVKPEHIPFEKLKKLTGFALSSAPQIALDFSDAPQLTEITINNSRLSSLSFGNSSALKNLTATRCGLKKIDLAGCSNLKNADFTGNALTGFDCSKNKKLEYLILSDNKIKKLDLKQNTRLNQLSIAGCSFTKISSSVLAVPKNGRLSYLDAMELKNCTAADLSHISSLKEAHISGALRTIKIGKNLDQLQISAAKMTVIDKKNLQVQNGAKLSSLTLDPAKLKTADLSHIKNLVSIALVEYKPAAAHTVQSIDLSGCTKLAICSFNGYPLKKLIVSRKAAKKDFEKAAAECGARLIRR